MGTKSSLVRRLESPFSLVEARGFGSNEPLYNDTQCFDPFPFPAAAEDQKATIRELGAQLDRHRKERLNRHDTLTMTALYNVMKKERRGEDLDKSEREIHDKGLIGVLKELHDELDAVALLSRVSRSRTLSCRIGRTLARGAINQFE